MKNYKTLPTFTNYSELGNNSTVVIIFTVNCYPYDKDNKLPYVSSKLSISLSFNVLGVIVLADGRNATLSVEDIDRYRGDDEWRFLGVDISKRELENKHDVDATQAQQSGPVVTAVV